jgi:putative ABC transport system permease protein
MSPLSNFLVFMVLLVTVIIIVMGITNRIIFKMAARNFSRRKAQSAIVIAGLMIGTAIISSALVVRDTMVNTFEVDVYRSLGEVDEEVWGTETWTTVVYFKFYNESIYDDLSTGLEGVSGIEAVAPVISDTGAVFDNTSKLGEPAAALIGVDSDVMRSTSFGDLDGKGFYPDSLGVGEVAINSRLADEMDASVGHELIVSYGARDLTNPMGTTFKQADFTVAKIISERDLNGKAQYLQQKTAFFELDTLQELLNRPGEINKIWISNDGDHREGESPTDKVSGKIQDVLDEAVGMNDLGLTLDASTDTLVLYSTDNFYPLHHAEPLLELADEEPGSTTMLRLVIPSLTLNSMPTNGMLLMGVESNEPGAPVTNSDTVYFFQSVATQFGIVNGSSVEISTMTMDGRMVTSDMTAEYLPAGHEAMLPEHIRNSTMAVLDFDFTQELLHGGAYGEDMVSFAMVSGLDESTLSQTRTELADQMDADFKGADLNLEVHEVKADSLEDGRTAGESLGDLFMIFGMFSIIAGIVLIVNIFVMLSEERKSEMGMARAVGMKGKHLVRMYIFEGSLYAFVAAIVGALLGLFFGWIIIQAFTSIFGSTELNEESFTIPFFFTWSSVFIAFCAGLLITFATILLASSRASKLNIIRAIRKIPEPKAKRAKKKLIIYGIILTVIGLLALLYAFNAMNGAGYLSGVPLLLIGLAVIAHRWVSFRPAITAAGVITLIILYMPWDPPGVRDMDFTGIDSFVLSGVFSVLAAILVVMFNSSYLLSALQKTVGQSKSTRAVLKTAISYPMASKFKTGMTLSMFALIIFTVTVIAMIASMQAAQGDAMLEQQSGEYDIMGMTNPRTPFENLTKESLPPDIESKVDELEVLSQTTVKIVSYEREIVEVSEFGPPVGGETMERYSLMGVEESFIENNGFTLQDWDKDKYETERDAWRALDNGSNCIVDGTRMAFSGVVIGGPPADMGGVYIGSKIVITDMTGQNRTREFTVIGIMDQNFFFNAIIVKDEIVTNEYEGADSMFVAKLKNGEDADAVAKDFEKYYLSQGVQTFDLKAIINTILSLSTNVMYLMEGFLGIGLLVGIAGIGIISYRNVNERRQQIGMLRAIGFKKGMVTKSFLIETSFVTILAILIGIILGIGVGWQIYDDGFRETGTGFAVPWLNLLAITLLAYFATLIFTFYPSLKASKIPPAEALRYIE